MIIIDRRKNPSNKSLPNRQRFADKVKDVIRKSARKAIGDRSIKDTSGTGVNIAGSENGIKEYSFTHDPETGITQQIWIGNTKYRVGDKIDKPPESDWGSSGGPGDPTEDEFEFKISYDEYLDIIFDDLELPNLENKEGTTEVKELRRAGFTNAGVPSNLSIVKTYSSRLSRKAALYWPKIREIEALEEELKQQDLDVEKRQQIIDRIDELRRKANIFPFFEDIDLRYNNRVLVNKPITQAVMICIMDCSVSMTEDHKITAKKFFLLLNRFLQRKYQNVAVVFIRHHTTAVECTEEAFFTDKESGGTIVSSSYQLMKDNVLKRFPSDQWNVYLAQASDGDNYPEDADTCVGLLEDILPRLQFMMYMEIRLQQFMYDTYGGIVDTELMKVMHTADAYQPNKIHMDTVTTDSQVVPMFRRMFAKRYA